MWPSSKPHPLSHATTLYIVYFMLYATFVKMKEDFLHFCNKILIIRKNVEKNVVGLHNYDDVIMTSSVMTEIGNDVNECSVGT